MDKKEDKRFYWEVKNFVNGNTPTPSHKPKADLKSAAKSVLEQNRIYQTSTFDAQSNAVDIGKNAVGAMANIEKGFNPSSIAYTKNKDMGSFQTLNESLIGSVMSGMGRGVSRATQQMGRVSKSDLSKYIVPGAVAGAMGGAAIYGGMNVADNLMAPQSTDDLEIMRKTAEERGGIPQSTDADNLDAMRKTAEEMGGIPYETTTAAPGISPQTKVTPIDSGDESEDNLDDLLKKASEAQSMVVPFYSPARRDQKAGVNKPSNYGEWKAAVEARNAALRQANMPLRQEQEKIRSSLRGMVDELQALRKKDPTNPRIAELEKEKSSMMQRGRKVYSAINPREGSLERGLETLRGISRSNWEKQKQEFTKSTGKEFDVKNTEHQNIMRSQTFPSITNKKTNY